MGNTTAETLRHLDTFAWEQAGPALDLTADAVEAIYLVGGINAVTTLGTLDTFESWRLETLVQADRERADAIEDAMWAEIEREQAERTEERRQTALAQPEPARAQTGKVLHVEWEAATGGRWWSSVREGALDWEIWAAARCGVLVSDIDG